MGQNKMFYSYVIPSIGGMLVTGLYFVIDGIFVGRGIGVGGLAAINIALPFISMLTAITMMITMGGAALTSISFGRGDKEKANQFFRISFFLVFLFAAIMSIFSLFFSEQIARSSGASDSLLRDTADYIKFYILFGVFYCGSMMLSTFIRNDANPKLAFWGMIAGACSNIFLDWLFIFPFGMGVIGAAVASGLGQLVSCIVLSFHFILRKGELCIAIPQFEWKKIQQIFKTGTPEFVTQMSSPVTTFCYNQLVIRYLGEIGVSAFSVISYIILIILTVFIGLAQGIQPLLSLSFGEKNKKKEQYFFKKGLRLNLCLSLLMYFMMLFFGKQIILIFNKDQELLRLAYACFLVYGISFLFAAVNIVYTIYYLSIKQTNKAVLIAVLRTFVLNVFCIFLVPLLLGQQFIWVGIIIAEALVMLVAIRSKSKLEQSSVQTEKGSF